MTRALDRALIRAALPPEATAKSDNPGAALIPPVQLSIELSPVGCVDFEALIVLFKNGAAGQIALDEIVAPNMSSIMLDHGIFHDTDPAQGGFAALDEL